MQSIIQHNHKFNISYSVTQNTNPELAEIINLKLYALPNNENEDILLDLDVAPSFSELPYIEFLFNRIVLEEDSSINLLEIAELHSAQLYNIIKPTVNPKTTDFIKNIFNIENTFDITHFIYLEKATIHDNFPSESLIAGISKAFSVLFKGVLSSNLAGGFFKRDTFYYNNGEEISLEKINQIIVSLNVFELSTFISQLPKENNTSCLFSGTFFNKKIEYIQSQKL